MTDNKNWRPSARFGRQPVRGGRRGARDHDDYQENPANPPLFETEEQPENIEYSGEGGAAYAPSGGKVIIRDAAIAVVLVVVVALALYVFLTGGRDGRTGVIAGTDDPAALPGSTAMGVLDPLINKTTAAAIVTPTQKPNQSEVYALDLTGGYTKIAVSDENINLPGMIFGELIYSAGTGTARLPVLKDLFLYDMETGTETKIAEAAVKNGEIFETLISQRWFVFIDTNQNGSNQICYIDRFSEAPEILMIKETDQALPKLRLFDDYLVWIEQTPEGTDEVWFFQLGTADNFPVTTLTDAATYGVSAPSIFGPEIIWAAPDPLSPLDADGNELSAIYVCDINKLSGDEVVYEYFSAGMYVHEPITNGEAWAWIDKNWAPDNGLYFKYRNGSNVIKVSEGVTSYALGDGILVYAKNMQIWAYFYETNTYARLTSDGGMQPVVSGRHVLWYDLSGDISVDKLAYKEVLLPGETPLPAPTPKPTPTPPPPPEEIVIIDVEEGGGNGAGGATPVP